MELNQENIHIFEQIAIVKFFVHEKTPAFELYCRLKRIYKNKVLEHKKIIKLYANIKQNNLGIFSWNSEDTAEHINMELDENGVVSNVCHYKSILNTNNQTEDDILLSSYNILKNKSRKAYFQTEFKEEAPDIELEYFDPVDYDVHSLVEKDNQETLFIKQYVEDELMSDVKLPFIPIVNPSKAMDVLAKLHTNYICKLCEPKDLKYASLFRRHLFLAHAKYSVRLGNVLTVRCRRFCVRTRKGHFHCSICLRAFHIKSRLLTHFKRHSFIGNKQISTPLHDNVLPARCVCVDVERGIYMVENKGIGLPYPVHVQVTNSIARCSEELCVKASDFTKNSCKHIIRVNRSVIPVKDETVWQENIYDTPEVNDLIVYADLLKVSPVVEWKINDNTNCYSVVSKDENAFMNRSLVEHSKDQHIYNCSTCLYPLCTHCYLVSLYQS